MRALPALPATYAQVMLGGTCGLMNTLRMVKRRRWGVAVVLAAEAQALGGGGGACGGGGLGGGVQCGVGD